MIFLFTVLNSLSLLLVDVAPITKTAPQDFPVISSVESGTITQLKPIKQKFVLTDGSLVLGLRSFEQNNQSKLLVWHSQKTKTMVVKPSDIQSKTNQTNATLEILQRIKQQILNKTGLQNTGLTSIPLSKKPFLTADFCPSKHKNFEQDFIKNFIKHQHKNIGIAITKKWIDQHPNGFAWLLEQQDKGTLNITWINHSSSHPYHFNTPLSKNFLISNQSEIVQEILETEKVLLEHGQTPSIFFRFPGLVSNQFLRNTVVNDFGLISLGSNAWLAKGEAAKRGSIILIHGNKNEPLGIRKAQKLLPTIQDFGNLNELFTIQKN